MIFQNKGGIVQPLTSIFVLIAYDSDNHSQFIRAYANEEDAISEQVRLMSVNDSLNTMWRELDRTKLNMYQQYLIEHMIDFLDDTHQFNFNKLWLTEQVKIFEKYKQPITKIVQTVQYTLFLVVEDLTYCVEEVPL